MVLDFIFYLSEECIDTCTFGDKRVKCVDGDTLLAHRVSVSESDRIVFERLVIYGDAVRGADRILTTITLADAVLLVVLTGEVEVQHTYHLLSLLVETILAYQGEHRELD